MIRLFLLAWCHVVFSATARGEGIERAYYFGPQDLSYWNLLPQSDKPFHEQIKREPLKAAPFESRFFSRGDSLWDLSDDLRKTIRGKNEIEKAIYNETTGRLVLRGRREAHSHVKLFQDVELEEMPRMLQINAKIYQVRRKSIGVTIWDGRKLAKNHQSLVEAETIARPGQKVEVKWDQLKMILEPQIRRSERYVELRIEMSGEVNGHSFDFKTGVIGYDGIPGTIELGAAGGDNVLVLSLTPEIVFLGGVKWSEVVFDVEGNSSDSWTGLKERRQFKEVWKEDPKTGKVFRAFQVHPSILQFLDPESFQNGEADPFAVDDVDPLERIKVHPMMKSWDSRVAARPLDRVVDLRPLLTHQGMKYSEDDFVCFVDGTSTIYAELDPVQMDLLDAIMTSTGPTVPRILIYDVSLVEGDQKIRQDDLQRAGLSVLAKGGLVARPGQTGFFTLGRGIHHLMMRVEGNLGANDDFIDFQGMVELFENEEGKSHWESGMTLISGKPQIVHSFKRDGKWKALVVEARMVSVYEWLLVE